MYRGSHCLLLMVMSISCLSYCAEKRTIVKRPISTPQSEESVKDSQEGKVRCCERVTKGIVAAICVISAGIGFYAQEQTQLTAICDNPASVNGFQLSSQMQVPQLKPATGPNECECWKPNLVICGEQSHTRISLMFSTTYRAPLSICRDREKEPVPLLQDRGRTELYDKATAYGAQNTKHVLYWQEHPCGMWPTIKNIFKKD